mgnify:CR=1 FL=1
MTQINIQFTRFSAFYSPLISTVSGGFLKYEGLDPTHSVSPPGKPAIAALVEQTGSIEQVAAVVGVESLEPDDAGHQF